MQWQILYKDGSVHTEDELKAHKNIDQSQLKEFALIKDGKPLFVMVMDEDKKLIYRKRTIMKADKPINVIYLVGYRPKKGKPVIFYITIDGAIIVDNARSNAEVDELCYYEWEHWNGHN